MAPVTPDPINYNDYWFGDDVIPQDVANAETTTGGAAINTNGVNHLNIMDPAWDKKWGKNPFSLTMAALPPKEPLSCEQKCSLEMQKKRKNCADVRRRVALTLKQMGCPSRVLPPAPVTKTLSVKTIPAKKVVVSKTTRARTCPFKK